MGKMIDLEQSAPLEEHPGYRVDVTGQLWRARQGCRLDFPDSWERIPSKGRTAQGPRVRIVAADGSVQSLHLATLVLKAFRKRERGSGSTVLYRDGNKNNVALENLTWCHPRPLTPEEVVQVVSRCRTGIPAEAMAFELGVAVGRIRVIVQAANHVRIPTVR